MSWWLWSTLSHVYSLGCGTAPCVHIFDTMILFPSGQLLLKSEAGVNWQLSEALRELSEITTMGKASYSYSTDMVSKEE